MKRISAKLGTMRKAREFIVQSVDDGSLLVQAENCIGKFDPVTRVGVLNTKGGYFVHLSKVMGAVEYTFPAEFVNECKAAVAKPGDLIGMLGDSPVIYGGVTVLKVKPQAAAHVEPDGTSPYMVENQRGLKPGEDWLKPAPKPVRVEVWHGGKFVASCADENAAFVYLLNHQSQSVDWAMKYEGWAFVPVFAVQKNNSVTYRGRTYRVFTFGEYADAPCVHLFGEMDLPLRATFDEAWDVADNAAECCGYIARKRGDNQISCYGDDCAYRVTYENGRLADVEDITLEARIRDLEVSNDTWKRCIREFELHPEQFGKGAKREFYQDMIDENNAKIAELKAKMGQ